MDQERIDVFLSRYREAPPDYIDKLRTEALAHKVPIIREGTQDVLRFLLRTSKPRRVLEVGTAVGYSALFMKTCLPDTSKITTIEKVPMRLVEAKKNLQRYDIGHTITLVEGDATDVLHQMSQDGERFDFIFMDAAKGQYPGFFPDVLDILAEGGTLVSDNIFHEGDVLESRYAVTRRDRTIHKRMRQYLQMLTECESLTTICLPISDGLTISTKQRRT